jgi:hypothetical protein
MRAIILLGLLVIGCSCGAPSETSTTTPTTPEAPETPPSPLPDQPARPSTYSVHEWGLVRSGPRDTLVVGAIGPAALPRHDLQVVEKPVLYFHLAGRSPLALTTASVTAVDGEIREHWPFTGVAASPMPTTIAWGPLTIETERCGVSVPIDRSAMPCAALLPGEPCESLELARVVSEDASCARIGESAMPFLFYRSTSRGLTVPIGAFYLDFDDINVTNTGTLPIPGRMFRFQRYQGETRVLVFDPPAPGQTILVNHAWRDAAEARAALTATILGLGLSEGEAAAFAASWDGAFFGPPAAAEDLVEERSVEHAEESPRPEDSVLYFLPPEMVESVARLTFEPPPTEVRRAMAVWTAL